MDEASPPTHVLAHRRPQEVSASSSPITAPFTAELSPPRRHGGEVFAVNSEVLWPMVTPEGGLKGPPELRLRWQFPKGASGHIVGFRRTGGFGREGDFGDCVVSCRGPGEKAERLEPGDYFYSFFRVRSILGLARAYTDEVRFAESIPSAAKVLELMRQAVEYKKLQQEYQRLAQPEPVPEDPLAKFEREFARAMAGVGMKFEAANRLREQWQAMKKQIEEGPYTERERKQRMRTLNGLIREFRERFEL